MQVKKLGPYRIGKEIGKGGMGTVYEAISEIPGEIAQQRVAIKALSPQLAMADGFRERFEAEIESLKKLEHQGIVRLYGYGEQDGILFYSMELVDGTSLEEEISTGRRFDWCETLKIGIQICRALKHAHDHGVVHRDIKPANLMLTSDNQVKVADFGIARLFGGPQLTTAGGVLGTADYMSPEQADGRAVSEKCDQYSLGGVLYALLTARPPFRAKSVPEMLQLQRFAEPEPVVRYAPTTPHQLDRLIAQLLAKDPEKRFPNILVLGRHMEAMEKALSRAVDSALGDSHDIDSQRTNPIPRDIESAPEDMPTQAIDEVSSAENSAEPDLQSQDLYDAPTLVNPEEFSEESASIPGETGNVQKATTSLITKTRETHFTTVEEDARRRRNAHHESRLATIFQLGTLVFALVALLGGGYYLMRPASADSLYAEIHAKIEQSGTDDLRIVADPLEEFLTRFPDDSRANELADFQEQLEFQRFERRIRTKSRLRGNVVLSPIEKIYFEAMAEAEDNPTTAVVSLRALVALYDPQDQTRDTKSKKLDSDQLLLVSARKQIDKLSTRIRAEKETLLPALQERLVVARKQISTDPKSAHRMYLAIIEIYDSKSWARPAVEEARRAIKRLTNNP
ncbi:MAG: serine/threonine protein kinase [Pirellulales bacterium]|nr:serine/threonine protein kinase [Pirellulales bacterium]HCK41050.1 hypothetical protein [Planctomycetaceae bacterium]